MWNKVWRKIITMRFPFASKGDKFFDLFEEGAANLVKIARTFQELVEKWEGVEEKVSEIADLEHEGDDVIHRIMANLHSTFVTPLDREDIALLANRLDDVVDFIHSAAEYMLIYRVGRPPQSALELANVIVEAAYEVEKAIPILRHRAELRQMLPHCVELNRLENEADQIMRRTLGEMFENRTDILDIFRWREIYEYMETATDRCEDVADILEGVALKHG
ncbi:MAG TPA: DUF47 family protein [Dehalococcoidia bacterium]|nr:DUF47 family protein [Dehalococcoidia bacterium]